MGNMKEKTEQDDAVRKTEMSNRQSNKEWGPVKKPVRLFTKKWKFQWGSILLKIIVKGKQGAERKLLKTHNGTPKVIIFCLYGNVITRSSSQKEIPKDLLWAIKKQSLNESLSARRNDDQRNSWIYGKSEHFWLKNTWRLLSSL